ncbi:hypothetical protein WN944_020917 [Citrus x changshan-huyou]|uniref:ABC-2 type transporter transmembrane domain-containing protein n=1 Tax=Citrus x changshan-huyou TaxID=2935761 RepID=A0AAP0R2E9_9ROSI
MGHHLISFNIVTFPSYGNICTRYSGRSKLKDPLHTQGGDGIRMSDSSFKILPMTEAAIEANNHNKRGMVLLFEPHYISLNEIVYSVDMPQARVLSSYRSDGVSGAGKTTLMDVLAGRKPGGYITRNITVSGYPEKQETFARILGDELISGLDARAATTVIRMVRNTVDMGRTVLFLLKQVGQEISVGPLGPSSIHLISYFEKIFGVSKIKDGYNLATWLLEVTALSQERAFGVDFSDIYRNSELYKLNNVGHTGVIHPAVRPLFTSTMAVMFGTVLIGTKGDIQQQQHLFNVMVSMYTAVLFLLVQNAGSLQLVAAVEWTIFYRESALGTYSAMPYALRK